MHRGDIVAVSLDPARGSEASKTRPAIVVSNDAANAAASRLARGVITVVPITSNVARVYPFQILLRADQTGLRQDSKAQAEQIRSVAVERIGRRLGRLPAAVMTELDEALRVHLAL
ncbi:MAG TPA: type II toxin-antitoxin system PemK/MazF family toxin [Streptosporangiaceae bacterium]|jgi:mRNA interferase MazF